MPAKAGISGEGTQKWSMAAGGYTYIMTAASRVTCAALNAGEKPAVHLFDGPSRLHVQGRSGGVVLQHLAAQLRQVADNGPIDALPGQTGTAAARQDGDAVRVTVAE